MKNKMYLRKYVVAICAMMLFCSHLLTAQNSQTRSASRNSQMPELNDWPKASKMAAEEMIKKYGQPDVSSEGLLVWMDKDHWKKIAVSREETEHNFPIDHTDMLEQSVSYKVPADKVDELVEFDGSVVVDRTQGLLSARCDMEANNLLALNLAQSASKIYADGSDRSFAFCFWRRRSRSVKIGLNFFNPRLKFTNAFSKALHEFRNFTGAKKNKDHKTDQQDLLHADASKK